MRVYNETTYLLQLLKNKTHSIANCRELKTCNTFTYWTCREVHAPIIDGAKLPAGEIPPDKKYMIVSAARRAHTSNADNLISNSSRFVTVLSPHRRTERRETSNHLRPTDVDKGGCLK